MILVHRWFLKCPSHLRFILCQLLDWNFQVLWYYSLFYDLRESYQQCKNKWWQPAKSSLFSLLFSFCFYRAQPATGVIEDDGGSHCFSIKQNVFVLFLSHSLSQANSYIISYSISFVKHFFYFFKKVFSKAIFQIVAVQTTYLLYLSVLCLSSTF